MTRVVRRRVATVAGLVVVSAVSAGCAGGGGAVQQTPAVGPARVSGPTVVAVGDIACAPDEQVTATKCQMAQTGRLAERLKPQVVIVLGDFQYGDDTLHSPRVYDRTWGRLKSITRPIPGNHEYETEGPGPTTGTSRTRRPSTPVTTPTTSENGGSTRSTPGAAAWTATPRHNGWTGT